MYTRYYFKKIENYIKRLSNLFIYPIGNLLIKHYINFSYRKLYPSPIAETIISGFIFYKTYIKILFINASIFYDIDVNNKTEQYRFTSSINMKNDVDNANSVFIKLKNTIILKSNIDILKYVDVNRVFHGKNFITNKKINYKNVSSEERQPIYLKFKNLFCDDSIKFPFIIKDYT